MKKIILSLVTVGSMLVAFSMYAVTFQSWNPGDTMTVYLQNETNQSIPYDFSNFMNSINNTCTPTGSNLQGTINPGQEISFSTQLPNSNETNFTIGDLDNFNSTTTAEEAPSIDSNLIFLQLWGGYNTDDEQYINMSSTNIWNVTSDTSEFNIIQEKTDSNPFIIRLDGGGNNEPNMQEIYFHITQY